MELPKNVVQIGKPDRIHKIFVEDYVVSYIKQLNRECNGKAIGLALYGKYKEENDCKYYFLYGASRVAGIEHRGPYLSQVEREEIEDIGKRYFEEYRFLAWCSLRGEPVEGFFVQASGKGMQVDGYACFYEKNESMLNFMLMTERQSKTEYSREQKAENENGYTASRGEWSAESVRKQNPQSVTTSVKQGEVIPMPATGNGKSKVAKKTEYMKVAVAAVFLVLCVIGITTLNDYEKMEDLQAAARQVIAGLTEQKLPDSPADVSGNGVLGSELTEISSSTETQQPAEVSQATEVPQTGAMSQSTETIPVPETPVVTESIPVAYTIAKGDTLISICREKYGSLERFSEICELNGIVDADSIQIGQTILLP